MAQRTNHRAPEDRYRRPKLPIVIPDRVAERAALAFEPSGKIRCGACYPTGNLTPVNQFADIETKAG